MILMLFMKREMISTEFSMVVSGRKDGNVEVRGVARCPWRLHGT
jgi:hypothetical protein